MRLRCQHHPCPDWMHCSRCPSVAELISMRSLPVDEPRHLTSAHWTWARRAISTRRRARKLSSDGCRHCRVMMERLRQARSYGLLPRRFPMMANAPSRSPDCFNRLCLKASWRRIAEVRHRCAHHCNKATAQFRHQCRDGKLHQRHVLHIEAGRCPPVRRPTFRQANVRCRPQSMSGARVYHHRRSCRRLHHGEGKLLLHRRQLSVGVDLQAGSAIFAHRSRILENCSRTVQKKRASLTKSRRLLCWNKKLVKA